MVKQHARICDDEEMGPGWDMNLTLTDALSRAQLSDLEDLLDSLTSYRAEFRDARTASYEFLALFFNALTMCIDDKREMEHRAASKQLVCITTVCLGR